MADDLILGETDETKPDEGDAFVEFTSPSEYIASAWYAYDIASDIDTSLLNKSDERRVRRLRRQSLRIVAECLNDLYNELFDDENENDE